MSLRFAILTALTEKSSTGIELARRFDRSIGYFWPASHQQIYRELDKLEGDGLVSVATSDKPPARGNPKVFAVTAAGTDELREWAGEPGEPRKARDPLMVRIRAAAALGDVDPRPGLERHLQLHLATLAEYEAIEAKQFSGDLDRAAQLQLLVLRSGIASQRAWVEWCRQALADLSG
ncbi:PadR family transcriptional regulator [Cumulibacter manganitolerans]|uniref:PadR family transcriptional regulator n=1 Tax=Cumulibacter manganitolerans TaxID=1884992 RepID=UPI001295CB3B|nr:PadR family transcriptional regulator [Cumulibacter manganitolerans]